MDSHASREGGGIPDLKIKTVGTGRSGVRLITGSLDFPCWDGYFLEEGNMYSGEEKRRSGGKIELQVDGGITADGNIDCSAGQVAAYQYLVAHGEAVKEAILQSLLARFPSLLAEDYQYFDHEEGGFPLPDALVSGFDFKDYVGPTSVTIMEIEKGDAAYTWWRFACRWDGEHGFGVIMHKGRIIDLGEDPDIWKVFKDNGTYDQEMAACSGGNNPAPYSWKQKKWWQFWK